MAISDYSTTPASNTSLSGIDITGATGRVNNGDNAIRQLMADIKAGTVYLSATSTFLAEATDAGATAGPILDLYRNSATPANADILGKVLFNGEDSGGGTQEYASIEAVIVDVTAASEDGQLDFYVTKAGARTKFQSMTATATAFTGAAAYTFDGPLTLTSTDAGATAGPVLTLYRDSATPAASDILGQVIFNGRDSAGNKQEYGELVVRIDDATATSEDGSMVLKVVKAGTVTSYLALGQNAAGTATADAIGLPLGQLSFPATQNASSDANTLDDYQENASSTTWAFATPGTSSWAYAGANTVNYTKVGDFVFIDLDLSATPTIGTGSGTLTITITGFPYTPAAITPLTISTMNLSWVWPASRTQVAAFMQTDGAIVVTGLGTGVSQSLFAASNMTSGSAHLLRMAGCVKVS